MNAIWKLDGWIMAKHQRAADLIHDRFGLSPYQVASHVFGAVAVASIVFWGNKIAQADGASNLSFCIFGATFGISVLSMWFWLALDRHSQYVRSKMTPPSGPFDDYFRVFFFVNSFPLGIWFVVDLIRADWYGVLLSVSLLSEISAFYFYGCKAPAPIQRRETKHLGKLVPEAG